MAAVTPKQPLDASGTERRLSFSTWLLHGINRSKPGYKLVVRPWLSLGQCVFAGIFAFRGSDDLERIAKMVMLPLVSVLIGLAFAFTGISITTLQTEAGKALSKEHPVGTAQFANYFHLTVLILFATVASWTVAASGPYQIEPAYLVAANRLTAFALGFLTAVALTECYGVMEAARLLVISKSEIERAER